MDEAPHAGCYPVLQRTVTCLESLDDQNLRALANRTLGWMRDEEFPRSDTEAQAMRAMEVAIRQARTLARLGIVSHIRQVPA